MESMDKATRPNSVAVIAWTWIIGGALMLVFGLIGLAGVPRMSEVMSQGAAQGHVTAAFGIRMALSNYIVGLTLGQAALSVVSVIAGVYLLKLRAWARGVIELLCWFTLISVIALGFVWFPLWMTLSDSLLPADGSVDVHKVKMVGVAAGGVVMVIAVLPLVAMIRSLRGPDVRRAVGSSTTTG
jgi:hypothetical protein